tara:strand:- start:232 stop:924 length:693 start_codon:yes stop_codon:yes gene_type:complete
VISKGFKEAPKFPAAQRRAINMYKTHGINCQVFSQRSADNLFKTVMMASSSIKQPWSSIGKQLKDILSNGADSEYLFSFKRETYLYMVSHKHKVHAQLLAVINSKKTDADKASSLMNVYLKVPGLGLAKAGFLCQLTAGLVGCMDSHNIKRYGVDPKTMRLNNKPKGKKALDSNTRKVLNYIDMCHDYGTENMWNSWCSHIATKDKQAKEFWQDANHVSEAHYTYLIESN